MPTGECAGRRALRAQKRAVCRYSQPAILESHLTFSVEQSGQFRELWTQRLSPSLLVSWPTKSLTSLSVRCRIHHGTSLPRLDWRSPRFRHVSFESARRWNAFCWNPSREKTPTEIAQWGAVIVSNVLVESCLYDTIILQRPTTEAPTCTGFRWQPLSVGELI